MKTTVMMVDDDPDFLKECSRVLTAKGYGAVAVSDSAKVVETARKTRPALILLNLRMPGTIGYALAFELKSIPGLSETPIIAMSGFFRSKNASMLELSGIRKCLAKPLNPSDIVQPIEETLAEEHIDFHEPFDLSKYPEMVPSKRSVLKRFGNLLKEMAHDIDPLIFTKMSKKMDRLKSHKKHANDFTFLRMPLDVTGRSEVSSGLRAVGWNDKLSGDKRITKGERPMKTIAVITKEELKLKLDQGEEAQIVNVLGPEYYHLGSIPGSRKIPLNELDDHLDELDKDAEVIVYCASYECQASKKAAEKLASKGFDVKAYEGGIKEWTEAGYPTEV